MLEDTLDEEGQPPHRHPSSYNKEFTGQSRFFIVDCKEFNAMDPQLIQDIFRHRHILVLDVDSGKRVDFNARGLSMLAPLDQLVPIQCLCLLTHPFMHCLTRHARFPHNRCQSKDGRQF